MEIAVMVNPREHDEAQAGRYDEYAKAERNLDAHVNQMHRMAGDRKRYMGRREVWGMTHAQMLDQLKIAAANGDERDLSHRMAPSAALAKENELRTEVAKIMLAIEEAETVYREHRWQRFFPCLNRDGHVHASLRGCPTVRFDTLMGWTPQLSGKTVADAVAELGEALCTVCFPAAPVAWTSKNLGQVKDEQTRAEREAAQAERDRVKYAKRLRDDEVFRIDRGRSGDRIETVAACKEVLRTEVEFRDYYGHGEHSWHQAYVEGAKQATRVLLAREARLAGTGATQAQIDKIVANAIKKNRKDGARI